MAAELTASFILKLEDQLSSGIVALSRKLEALSALGRKLGLGGLTGADRVLDTLGASAERAGRKVGGIGRQARAALDDLRRLSSQPIMVNTGGTAFLPPSMSRPVMAAAMAAAAAAYAGGAGGGVPALMPDAPFLGGPQLMLGGPDGGGIPLAFNPAAMRAGRMADAWRSLRTELGRTAVEAQRVGQELGHAGHAALTAAATGFALFHSVHSAAALDAELRQVAIVEGRQGGAATAEVARLRELLSEDARRTGQPVLGLAEAYRDLVSRGMRPELVDRLIGIHSRAATAYDVDPVAMGQLVYAMNTTLGIRPDQMEGALAATMQGTHAGSFNMAALARYLPQISGQMRGLGWTGRGSLDSVVSMLEIVSKQAGTPEEAATSFHTMMDTLTAKYTVRSFRQVGINLPARMAAARKAGANPVDAYLDILQGMIKGVSDPMQQMYILSKVLHNQTAATAVRSILQFRQQQRELAEQLHRIGADKLARDYQTAMAGIEPQLRRLTAEWQVFEMRLGMGFARLVGPTVDLLDRINHALDWMDQHLPGLVDTVLSWGGGFVAVTTALGVLIPLFRAMRAGALLFLAPLRLIGPAIRLAAGAVSLLGGALIELQIDGGPILWLIEALVLGALLIWYNWGKLGPRFAMLWSDLQDSFGQFERWVSTWISGAMQGLIDRFKAAWDGLKTYFAGLWNGIVKTFDDLIGGVERKIEEIKHLFGDGKPAAPGVPLVSPQPAPRSPAGDLSMGRILHESYHPGPGGTLRFEPIAIHVTTDGLAHVQAPTHIMPVNPGEMLGRSMSTA